MIDNLSVLVLYCVQGMNSSTSALHICVWRDHSKAAAWLLDSGGATLELPDENGATPLLIDIARVGIQQMFPVPFERSRCIDVSSHVEVRTHPYMCALDVACQRML